MTWSDNTLVNYTTKNVANELWYVEFMTDIMISQSWTPLMCGWMMMLMANPWLPAPICDWCAIWAFGPGMRLLCIMITRVLWAVFLSRASRKIQSHNASALRALILLHIESTICGCLHDRITISCTWRRNKFQYLSQMYAKNPEGLIHFFIWTLS